MKTLQPYKPGSLHKLHHVLSAELQVPCISCGVTFPFCATTSPSPPLPILLLSSPPLPSSLRPKLPNDVDLWSMDHGMT